MSRIFLKLFFFLFAIHGAASAQERITTDRPDQTESPVLVPKHYFQAEIGIGAENFDANNYTIIHPTVLLKYGLGKRIELRLENNFVSSYRLSIPAGTVKTTGFEPIRLGFKLAWWEDSKL